MRLELGEEDMDHNPSDQTSNNATRIYSNYNNTAIISPIATSTQLFPAGMKGPSTTSDITGLITQNMFTNGNISPINDTSVNSRTAVDEQAFY